MNRRGFALIAVLWVVTVLSGVVGLGLAGVRLSQRAWQNRMVLTRSRWAAEACIAIADRRFRDGEFADTFRIDLGQTVLCEWVTQDPTSRLNLNKASVAQIDRLPRAINLDHDSSARFSRAILELRRAGEIEDIGAVALLPGFDPQVMPYVTVDGPGTVNAATASPVVLRTLPGMTEEALWLIVDRRRARDPITSLDALVEELSPASRAVLVEHYGELARTLGFETTYLVVTFHGWLTQYGSFPRAEIELLMARSPGRLAVLRRRMR